MATESFNDIFTGDVLDTLLPSSRADEFFDALYGDADEGAYDISLAYTGNNNNTLEFALELKQRSGKCLACNLTYGLPDVFTRHPLINLKGIVAAIDKLVGDDVSCTDWTIGRTREISREMHIVPLMISLG